jgi:hypothetical protein
MIVLLGQRIENLVLDTLLLDVGVGVCALHWIR